MCFSRIYALAPVKGLDFRAFPASSRRKPACKSAPICCPCRCAHSGCASFPKLLNGNPKKVWVSLNCVGNLKRFNPPFTNYSCRTSLLIVPLYFSRNEGISMSVLRTSRTIPHNPSFSSGKPSIYCTNGSSITNLA